MLQLQEGIRVVSRQPIVVAALALGAVALPAQGTPNFSGKWTVVPNETPAAGQPLAAATPGSGWGAQLTFVHDAATLSMEYTPYAPRDVQPPIRFTYRLDGSESHNVLNVGRGDEVLISKASWSGAALTIATAYHYRNPETAESLTGELRQTLSLENPTTLLIETTRIGVLGGASMTTRTRYTKT
ncbi:MAG: hypothetical protein AB1762_07900 [Gemmatimonadota bacterium]